ncbi:coniferyl alcohol acyltransferase-like [Miscanthus floridulus]|uniref:coniferyl alcohol acyltransferase-like n=1 Tax=Miscanthus floridulus TaxID=154761 RepID=UPI003459E3DD
MASANGSNDDLHVQVVSRRYVKASDASIAPHVVAVSNLDLVPQPTAFSMSCIYPWSGDDGFSAVVACFEAGLPGLLNHFFPLAGRIASNPCSGLPELHCGNQGAELVVGEARVALASLDYSTQAASLERIVLPYGGEDDGVALSVQLVSFACGGFAVSWCTDHVLVDGTALCMLVGAWSELARSGTLAVGSQPNHDRSVFRPRAPPSYGAALDESFTPLPDAHDPSNRQQVDDGDDSIVKRLYYVEARDVARLRDAATSRDREGQRAASCAEAVSAYLWKALAGLVVGTAHDRCRVGLVVDGRRRFTSPGLRAYMRSYVGNVSTLVVREASAQELVRTPLPEVSAMVREAVSAPAYDEHFQELVDWVEEHKGPRRYAQTASQGLGSPAVIISSFLGVNTDFGFGHAAVMLPMAAARLSSGFVRIMAAPGGRGSSWIVGASLRPRLAAALIDSVIFKPLTAEHLGLRLLATQDRKSRL